MMMMMFIAIVIIAVIFVIFAIVVIVVIVVIIVIFVIIERDGHIGDILLTAASCDVFCKSTYVQERFVTSLSA